MRLPARLRQPQTTVRWKLTLLYGGLFLVCGAALLAITYALVAQAEGTPVPVGFQFANRSPNAARAFPAPAGAVQVQVSGTIPAPKGVLPAQLRQLSPQARELLLSSAGGQVVRAVGSDQRIADLHQLELWSGIALGIMAVVSAFLGWLVAGRVLRPLRTITAATRQISEANLHERLALAGPRDELGELADTIDGLLERLEGAFDAQRRFVANASHELRTPLTATRALLEMAVSDPTATVATFRETCRQALEESEQQESLIEALLALAHGQRGIERPETVDLATVATEVLSGHEDEAAGRGVRLDCALEPTPISGDRQLIQRLISNLLQNAIRYNHPDGQVHIQVRNVAQQAVLSVANSGPLVPAGEIRRLLQPFQRLAPDRVGHCEGLGLGLSIVAAIARAHCAALDIRPRSRGGLDVEVRFPQTGALANSECAGRRYGTSRLPARRSSTSASIRS